MKTNSRMTLLDVFSYFNKTVYTPEFYRFLFCCHTDVNKRLFTITDAMFEGIFNKRNKDQWWNINILILFRERYFEADLTAHPELHKINIVIHEINFIAQFSISMF